MFSKYFWEYSSGEFKIFSFVYLGIHFLFIIRRKLTRHFAFIDWKYNYILDLKFR